MAIRANRNLGRLYSKPPQHLNGHQRSGSYNKMWVHIFVCVIKNQQFPEYILKRSGDKFARCTACEKYKGFWDVHPIGTESLTIHQRNNIEHVNNQEAHHQDYFKNLALFIMRPNKSCDDHSWEDGPCQDCLVLLCSRIKDMDGFFKL